MTTGLNLVEMCLSPAFFKYWGEFRDREMISIEKLCSSGEVRTAVMNVLDEWKPPNIVRHGTHRLTAPPTAPRRERNSPLYHSLSGRQRT